jgi:hypothetical protein
VGYYGNGQGGWVDQEYDLFWASMEIMKPAVYARPPDPVVSPQFKDRRPLPNLTAELLERTVKSAFDRSCLDEAMICARDDLIFYNRGQLWCTYETEDGEQRVCIEHLDRKDFLHPPARKWSDVPWVARRAWMTRREMRKRFRRTSQDAYQLAVRSPGHGDNEENKDKIGVWEVWHKADKKVYWVCEGVEVMLDEDEPHLKLKGFFPCPRPAFGTLRPRSLVPRPDYERYRGHFAKINSLTKRIYALLDMVRMKGLIPAGGDVGDAVEQALRDDSNTALLIPVPAAALIQGSTTGFVQWMPLEQIAQAITGLIEARRELFSDFDRLSGISDIMRGETEATETLGAQQLKGQYGSVRIKEKVRELQRIACDVTQIAAEIMADKFSKETFLEMSQMEIPSAADVRKKIKEIEAAAKEEVDGLTEQVEQMIQAAKAQGQEVDPAQAQQQFEQARQQIVQRYSGLLSKVEETVPIEDVMRLLRDDKARGFAFEIATDSTILTDELQEKATRNEFLETFASSTQGLISLAALGERAAALAGGVLKFSLQPYRVGRELNSLVDDFIDAAPQMAQQGQGDENQALAAAQDKLAEAELAKARAQTMKVEADAASKSAEHERKIGELQLKMQRDQQEMAVKMADADAKANAAATQAELLAAQVDKLRAETAKILNSIGLDARKQELEEYTAAQGVDMAGRKQAVTEVQVERGEMRADRQQDFTEQSSERQMTLAERQALEPSL